MKAELLFKERLTQGNNGFVELILWSVPYPVAGSRHTQISAGVSCRRL